jgi:hypothetical protein
MAVTHPVYSPTNWLAIIGLIVAAVQGKPVKEEYRIMAKKDRQIMQQLNHAARLARTALATKLLEQNLYAGQDQLMLALAQEDGQRLARSRPLSACARRP